MLKYRGRIGEELVDAGLVTKAQVEEALQLQKERGGKTVENLVALGYLTVEQFVRFQKSRPGMPSLDLSNYALPRDIVALVPRSFAVENQLIPIDKMGRTLTVGMSFPLDQPAIEALEEMTGLRVRPVLCSVEDVHAAIQRYYGAPPEGSDAMVHDTAKQLEADLKLSSLSAMIRQIDSLPGLPETVQKVRQALTNDCVTLAEVAGVIRRDPPVAAKLIGVANSAAFALSQRVDSVETAASLLGLRDTYALVSSMAVLDHFSGSGKSFETRFWKDAQDCALVAVAITRGRGIRQTGMPYSAALLHDIGRLLLATLKHQQYAAIEFSDDHESVMNSEKGVFGLAHPEAGYLLAQAWNLPQDLAEAIRFHADYRLATVSPQLAATVQLANVMLDARKSGVEYSVADIAGAYPDLLEVLKLPPEVMPALNGVIRGLGQEV